ncbi:glycosyltransferase family 2 protein [Desulfobotulus mexicanus]|uniref:Glycosyltransferase n=1 Tax=Desulfobotulus mexicanus TaxID=2586642 RepID=A0A5Q4VJ31_9BACT|nr:glycosyltransferase family 2 protein [Desulfobotulus mexicanus]TYT76150.1 glycosyltransferase [Desulfobotulus mexicanus]
MKISIITVCYNSQSTILDTIKSVFSQTHSDVEYIIIDGGSSDDTLKIISNFKNRIAKIVSEPDNGIYSAMNKGLALVTGDIVGILNSDDFYANNRILSKVAETFEREQVDCVFGDLVYVDAVHTERIVRYWKSSPYKHGLFQRGWHPPHPTFFVKKELYLKFGNFDESFMIASDIEIMLRFIERYNVRPFYISKILVKMRCGGTSNQSLWNIFKANIECYKAYRINGVPQPLTALFLKLLSRPSQYFKRL